MEEIKLEPRDYQKEIFETTKRANTLVVLPTGLGKTLIALMLSVERKKKFPLSKILFLAPTRPLVEQHFETFKKNLPELFAQLELFTGEVNASKRRNLFQNAEIIFSTPQCLDGETIIFTEDGPIKISEFFNKFEFREEEYLNGKAKIANIKEKVLGYDGKQICFVEASKALKLQGKGLIEIKTEIGNTLVCTADHPLLTINSKGEMDWKETSQLSVGDYIGCAKEIEIEEKNLDILKLISASNSLKVVDKLLITELIKGLKKKNIKTSEFSRYYRNAMPISLFLKLAEKAGLDYDSLTLTDSYGKSNYIKLPTQLDFKLSYILGAMLGDGHLGNRKGHGGEVVFSDLDRISVCNEFQEMVREVFGVKMKKESRKGLISYNSAFASLLYLFGIPKGRKAKIIQVPRFMFFADIKSIKGFLKGIFDTDGHASRYGVSISSVSERFITELKWLFLRIGILGSIEKRAVNNSFIQNRKINGTVIFTFKFSGRQNLLRFLEISPNRDKCKNLIKTLNSTKKPETRSKEILPVLELMKKIRNINKNKTEYYKFSCLSVDNLKKISVNLEGKEAAKLRELLSLPIRWVKIKEKKENNIEKEVYDLTVDKHHNFIANCLINHNCIANDLNNKLYDLSEVSLLVIDEAHRCLKNYDYTKVVNFYKEQAGEQRILGMTASPGSEKERVNEICKHLAISEIEIRTRESEDVRKYLQELEFEKVDVPFPAEFVELKVLLKRIYDSRVEELRSRSLLFGMANKITLLKLQGQLAARWTNARDFNAMRGMSLTASAIKISHAMELLETQTLSGLKEYLQGLVKQANEKKSKAVQQLVASNDFKAVLVSLNDLLSRGFEHPKVEECAVLIENEFKSKADSKIIVFTQFRETAVRVVERLKKIKLNVGNSPQAEDVAEIRATTFFGQAKKGNTGLSQKEQKEIIRKLNDREINVIVATSIGEEGLDIAEVSAVIFYEPIPSEIRKIQRMGRTARLSPGKVFILVTKDTRDVGFYYASRAREKKMHKTIEGVRDKLRKGEGFGDSGKSFVEGVGGKVGKSGEFKTLDEF